MHPWVRIQLFSNPLFRALGCTLCDLRRRQRGGDVRCVVYASCATVHGRLERSDYALRAAAFRLHTCVHLSWL